MNREDVLLMVVAAGQGTPLTPVQLQKSLFLIGERLTESLPKPLYEFEPYHYGPFNGDIYADADDLESQGYLVSVGSTSGTWLDRAITTEGAKRVEVVEQQLPRPIRDYIHTIVEWSQSMSFSQLVRSIYAEYPEYRQNSVFQN